MGMSRNQTQITWSAAAKYTCTSNSGTQSSDAFTFDSTDVGADVTVSLGTQDTAASGDYADVYIRYLSGAAVNHADGSDPGGAGYNDGGTTGQYDTVEHATYLGRLDNYATDTPGENPAQMTVPVRTNAPGFKIYVAFSANCATRRQTVWASVSTQRAS